MSSSKPRDWNATGPFRPDQVRSGDPYEVSNGHAVWCAPTGGDGAGPNGRGFMVLDTDPLAANAGVDAGMQMGPLTMRAPDVAVGAFNERGGWIQGALPLAVEYASKGQDEDELREKIEDLLSHGTKYVWVVRLLGPRRVEVYERGKATRTVLPGESLTAPGVLQNPVRVEALYDREAAQDAALTNLLQRRGYRDLDAVREAGIEKGIERGIEKGIERGIEKGIEKGIEAGVEKALGPLEHQFARRLSRVLTADERATLVKRLDTHGPDRLGDVVLDLDAAALDAWLRDPAAT